MNLNQIKLTTLALSISFIGTTWALPQATSISNFQGPWRVNDDALKKYNSSKERFGTFEVKLKNPDGTSKSIIIKDNVYPTKTDEQFSDSLGIRAIPVRDPKVCGTKDPENCIPNKSRDSSDMDKFLRYVSYGDENSDGDIFAVIGYTHLEQEGADFSKQADRLRTESGITHLGAYIGKGRTRNAPENYHKKVWHVKGYPAHLYTVSLKGVDQKVLNKNMLISLRILNETGGGPQFPDNYKFDYFRTYNIKEVISFYRAWLDHTWVRKEFNEKLVAEKVPGVTLTTPFYKLLTTHPIFETYCAEHIAIALNVGANIVHTKDSYIEIWGTKVGTDLFAEAEKRWFSVTSKIIPQDMLKTFDNPLWKRRINLVKATDLETTIPLVESNYFKNIAGTKNEILGTSMLWAPETTADLIADFIRVYANFTKVEFVRAALAVISFAPLAEMRLGIEQDKYIELAGKFLEKMLKQDIMLKSAQKNLKEQSPTEQDTFITDHFTEITLGLTYGLKGQGQGDVLYKLEPHLNYVKGIAKILINHPVTKESFDPERKTPKRLKILSSTNKNPSIEDIAWILFANEVNNKNGENVESLMEKARNLLPAKNVIKQLTKGGKYVQYYIPPAIMHRLVHGAHSDMADPDLVVQVVATAVDHTEITDNEDYDSETDNKDEIYEKIKKTSSADPSYKKVN